MQPGPRAAPDPVCVSGRCLALLWPPRPRPLRGLCSESPACVRAAQLQLQSHRNGTGFAGWWLSNGGVPIRSSFCVTQEKLSSSHVFDSCLPEWPCVLLCPSPLLPVSSLARLVLRSTRPRPLSISTLSGTKNLLVLTLPDAVSPSGAGSLPRRMNSEATIRVLGVLPAPWMALVGRAPSLRGLVSPSGHKAAHELTRHRIADLPPAPSSPLPQ